MDYYLRYTLVHLTFFYEILMRRDFYLHEYPNQLKIYATAALPGLVVALLFYRRRYVLGLFALSLLLRSFFWQHFDLTTPPQGECAALAEHTNFRGVMGYYLAMAASLIWVLLGIVFGRLHNKRDLKELVLNMLQPRSSI